MGAKFMSKAKAVFLILAALLMGYFAVLRLFMPGFLQQMIPLVQTTAAEYVNGEINIGSLHVSDSLQIAADDVAVYDTKGKLVASSPSVTVSFNLWKGLMQADPIKAVNKITVNQPVFHLQMDDKEHWNVKDVIKQREPEKSRFAGLVKIIDGRSEVATPFGNWSFGVDGRIQQFSLDARIAAIADARLLADVVRQQMVEVIAAERGIPAGRQHFKHPAAQAQD